MIDGDFWLELGKLAFVVAAGALSLALQAGLVVLVWRVVLRGWPP